MRLPSSAATKRSAPQKAESIRSGGLIQPIVVRPKENAFEIVAGARRFRAGQLAEQFSLPTRIKELTDAQALEWQLVELSIVGKSFHPAQQKGNLSMKVTISFGNPFVVTIYTVALMASGWGIGAHFGHTISSAWMLFFAIIFLLLHDAAIAILLAIAAIKVASSGQ